MEDLLRDLNHIVVSVCQFLAMLVISVGIVKALFIYLKDALTPGRSTAAVRQSRLELGHSFSLGLGLLIGASILKTTLAPTWADIGQLSAIIAIRTVLNYFLLYDIAKQTEAAEADQEAGGFLGLFRRSKPSAEQAPKPHEN